MAETENEVVVEEEEITEEAQESSIGDDLRQAMEQEEPPTEEEPVQQVSTPEEGVVEEATGAVAPEHWPAEEREVFDALPEEAKTFALSQGERLYSHHQKRMEELSSERESLERLKPLEQEMAPYREQLRLQGVAEQDVVRQLMAVRHSLQTAPADTIRWLAQQTGVDLNQIETETLVDPQEQRLAQVEQQVQQSNQANAQAIQQQQHNVAYQQAESALGQFMSAKDENGNLLHPHVENVQVTMTELANADIASQKQIDLEDLYQRAIWQNAETRDVMLKERDGTVLAKQKQNQKQRVSRAKRADTTIRSTADSPASPQVSLRQELSDLLGSA
tara:strand:- start:317 stop:1315 length:999 start_codon:yes stop_codon:yes gene_type:complete